MFLRLLLCLFLLISWPTQGQSSNENSTQFKNLEKALKKKKPKRKLTKKKNAALEQLMKKLRMLLPELNDEELSTLLEDPVLLLQILNKLVEDKKMSPDELKKIEGLLKGAIDYDVKKEELAANAKTRGKGEPKPLTFEDLINQAKAAQAAKNKSGSSSMGGSGAFSQQPFSQSAEEKEEDFVNENASKTSPTAGIPDANPGRNQRNDKASAAPTQPQARQKQSQSTKSNSNPYSYKKTNQKGRGAAARSQPQKIHQSAQHSSLAEEYRKLNFKLEPREFDKPGAPRDYKNITVPVSYDRSSTSQAVTPKKAPEKPAPQKPTDKEYKVNWGSEGVELDKDSDADITESSVVGSASSSVGGSEKSASAKNTKAFVAPTLYDKFFKGLKNKATESFQLLKGIVDFRDKMAAKSCGKIPVSDFVEWDAEIKNGNKNFQEQFVTSSNDSSIFNQVNADYPKAFKGGYFDPDMPDSLLAIYRIKNELQDKLNEREGESLSLCKQAFQYKQFLFHKTKIKQKASVGSLIDKIIVAGEQGILKNVAPKENEPAQCSLGPVSIEESLSSGCGNGNYGEALMVSAELCRKTHVLTEEMKNEKCPKFKSIKIIFETMGEAGSGYYLTQMFREIKNLCGSQATVIWPNNIGQAKSVTEEEAALVEILDGKTELQKNRWRFDCNVLRKNYEEKFQKESGRSSSKWGQH